MTEPSKVLLLGAGQVGRFIACHLKDVVLDVVDPSPRSLAWLRTRRLGTRFFTDATPEKVVSLLRETPYDLVISAVPGAAGYAMARTILAEGASLVDVSFYPPNPVELADAVRPGAIYVPDAGIAPGLSNLFAGRCHHDFGGLRSFHCYVGGLPRTPRPPLFYEAPFHPADALDEYVRPAGVISNGRIAWRDPMTTFEHVSFFAEEVGPLTAFYSDGLRSLLHTLPGVETMAELTLRYRPHLELMRSFYELGFTDAERRNTLAEWLMPHLRLKGPDVTLMYCRSVSSGGTVRTFRMIDGGASRQRSMSKVTGSVAVVAARAVLSRRETLPEEGGFYPLECLPHLWEAAVQFLRAQGARIEESETPA